MGKWMGGSPQTFRAKPSWTCQDAVPLVSRAATLVSADAFSMLVYAPNDKLDGLVLHAIKNTLKLDIAARQLTALSNPNLPVLMSPVQVPGGQQIYIQEDGQVKYTRPHSAYMPSGSITGGWYHKATGVSECLATASLDVVNFSDGNGNGGLKLCPVGPGGSFRLYAQTAKFGESDCYNIEGLTLTKAASNIGSWQYE
ncbi:hypothetical protein EKO27_g4856 [Xylaria grammica]|uniref:Uncharacterized protein n=1 Tax=Xylaria grammica TaxID=363999 RepID=A0A439D772_9PEZI|nr:hypothetical protein EKO27_g4856 [Xylaria grammica]